jgi:positive regulator of sigma E activity
MKPSIPDSGTVISLEGDNAVVRMKHDGSCRKCGAAAIGLCKGGLMQELTVRNSMRARTGDTVKIGLVRRVQYKGYVLAYAVPAVGFLFGAMAGHFLGTYTGFPPLDIIGGFFSLIGVSFISFGRLKRLDSANSIEIVQVLSGPWCRESLRSDEGALPGYFIDQAGPYLYR